MRSIFLIIDRNHLAVRTSARSTNKSIELQASSPVIRSKRIQGLTLLEVLISMVILVFISFAIYQATTQTFKLRETLAIEGSFYNSIRLATTIFQRDVALLYTPLSISPTYHKNQASTALLASASESAPYAPPPPPALNAGGAPQALPGDLSTAYTFWAAALDTTGLRPSRLIGTENTLSFVSASHLRVYRNSPECELAKISYTLQPEQASDLMGLTPAVNSEKFQVWVRSENTNVFAADASADFSKDPRTKRYQILKGIRSLSYAYLIREGATWKTLKSWDSSSPDNQNRFPEVIEVHLDISGGKYQSFEAVLKYRPEMTPNALKLQF